MNNISNKVNNIKLIALDIDGTCMDSHGIISDYTYNVIKQLANNYILVPCSGRGYYNIKHEIFSDLNINYIVSANGAVISKDNNGQEYRLQQNLIPMQQGANIVQQYLNNENLIYIHRNDEKSTHIVGCLPDDNYSDDFKKVFNKSYTNDIKTDLYSYILKDKKDIVKIGIKFLYPEKIDSIKKSIEDNYSDINVFKTGGNGIEITNSNASKGASLKYLCDYLNIDSYQVCAIGDNGNDLSMLQYSGLSVAMGNSIEQLKDISDYVCLDNNSDGCGKFFAQYFLK